MKPTTVLLACALGLGACAPAALQTRPESGSLPGMYRPGPKDSGPPAEAAASPGASQPDVQAADVGVAAPVEDGAAVAAVEKRSPLAPQELPRESADTFVGDANPKAGPAPRNAISGGVLDVGVVAPAPEGSATVAAPTHGIEPTDSGRLYILELYQEVLEQRDALELEVSGLHAELERTQAELAALRDGARSDDAAVAALEEENAALVAENRDLAARLVTAQIRRLEAEKLLLEAKIEAQRAKLEEPPPVTSGIALGEKQP